jgi:hypothetical protein
MVLAYSASQIPDERDGYTIGIFRVDAKPGHACHIVGIGILFDDADNGCAIQFAIRCYGK